MTREPPEHPAHRQPRPGGLGTGAQPVDPGRSGGAGFQPGLDLTDPAPSAACGGDRPRIIVNPAAHTAVDKAESERNAPALNATAPGVLAEEAEKLGALLVHYSTDYVFDGSGEQAALKTDAPGRSTSMAPASWRVSRRFRRKMPASPDFPDIVGLWPARGQLPADHAPPDAGAAGVEDRRRPDRRANLVPQHCRRHGAGSGQVDSPLRGADKPEPWGVYHMTNAGETSWHGFAAGDP
jgi:dTDP-4-dehydrorhamnose reductase